MNMTARFVEDPLEQAANNAAYNGLERVALAHPVWTRHVHDWLRGKISDLEFLEWFEEYQKNPEQHEQEAKLLSAREQQSEMEVVR